MFCLFSYFDFTSGDKWNNRLPELLQKLQEEVNRATQGDQREEEEEVKEEQKDRNSEAITSHSASGTTSGQSKKEYSLSSEEAQRKRWLQLRGAIPRAEEDDMALEEFRALTPKDLEQVIELVGVTKRGGLRKIYNDGQRKRWLQLRGAIPHAEEDDMALEEFKALTPKDLEQVMELVRVTKRGGLRKLYNDGN